jgi:alginate O-acetyltransferase complex protein AlgI
LSYIAFRIIHTLRERMSGRLPAVSLQEYVSYIFFFPAITAGPIDRLERFIEDLRRPLNLTQEDWRFTAERLAWGLLKKFVLADSLALMALNIQNAPQIQSAGWAWIILYAYSLQIFFDFSGYTDIAIGLARLLGIRLPENFNAPYARPNLTQFWSNWHMTLTQWFRAYFFNPLTRALRERKWSAWSVILTTQLATMILIGLWHGVTWNFVIWGAWHGLGQFIHNRWLDAFRSPISEWANTPARQSLLYWSGWALTFNYVALGWVWFVLPTPEMAVKFIAKLFGINF